MRCAKNKDMTSTVPNVRGHLTGPHFTGDQIKVGHKGLHIRTCVLISLLPSHYILYVLFYSFIYFVHWLIRCMKSDMIYE